VYWKHGQRSVAAGHSEDVGTLGDGVLGQSPQVVARVQHDRCDPPTAGFVLEVDPLDLASSGRGFISSTPWVAGATRRRVGGRETAHRHGVAGGGHRDGHQADHDGDPDQ
jgi:hypothetical protein